MPLPPQAGFAAAMAHFQAGRLDAAEALCLGLLAAQPRHADALHLRGVIAHRRGRPAEAASLIRDALAVEASNPSFHHNLGSALQAAGEPDAAAQCFAQVLALRPDAAEAHFALGNLAQAAGRLADAAPHYRRAIACKPGYAEAHNNLSLALLESGQLAGAAQAAARAVALTPGSGRYWRNYAETRRFTADDPGFPAMAALLCRAPPLPPGEQVTVHFALAKAWDDIGEPARAFAHLRDGNALHRAANPYDEAGTLALLRRIRACFGRELIARRPAGDPSAAPVFIIGMPRSGTTLVEQILASHPSVHGGGEREALGQAVARLPGGFPEGVAALPPTALEALGRTYAAAAQALAPGAARITDKMPRNGLFAGLVHLALPRARIIHVQRDPVDTCLSCFSKLFAGQHPYAYDLGELGRYWRAHDALMQHWRAVLPGETWLDVRYEDIVAGLEAQARRLLAHCGLDWDPACLAFHDTARPVRTASSAQVRQPLYAAAVGRSGAYRPWLGPLLEALRL